MPAHTNRESDKFMLRLPEGMRDRIKDAAEANSRSMNAEIIARLEQSFEPILATEIPYGTGNLYEMLLGMDARIQDLQQRLEAAKK